MEIKTALILCAGYGKRLNPLTLELPKPLLKLNNITLLEKTFNLIKSLGIKKVKLNTFYLKEKIKNFINDLNLDLDIEIIEDGNQILNTGGGILNMVKKSNEENFIVFNPDTIWSNEYVSCIKDMEKAYFKEKTKNTLLVVNKILSFDQKLGGDFNLNNNILKKENNNNFIYTGCQMINKNLFLKLSNQSFSILDIWNDLLLQNKLFGHESKNKFYHVTDLRIYQELLKN
ncbi:MAG: sugar phosphate nucleotidyltransferase [Candidatus Pelagibacter sp.]|tara:strand:+ start:1712 stop:2401 length:690 start_codon:yes stop_codon:yes gene_type:complete